MFQELDMVRLTRDFEGPDGVIPKGTEGVVLIIFDEGAAYIVEFAGPYDVPETVYAEWLESSSEHDSHPP